MEKFLRIIGTVIFGLIWAAAGALTALYIIGGRI